MDFTTRPDIRGTFGVVSTTHWIASSAGMAMLERGGNAFDAAAAAGFVLQIVEPHLNGPGGDLPAIFVRPDEQPQVLCAQGSAPAAATIEAYRAAGLTEVPGSGLLASVVPGAFDGWMLMLRDFGNLPLDVVLEPAIFYAEQGHPALPRLSNTVAELANFFRKEWPSSAEVWMPGGKVPAPHAIFRNEALARTWRRLLRETEGARSREARIEAARSVFYRGFIAESVDTLMRGELMDSSGQRNKGLLTAADMAGWQAHYEPTVSGSYNGWTIHKTGPWGQGPVLLQALNILRHTRIEEAPINSAEFVHLAAEALKLAFADRDTFYGDPDFSHIPLDVLLSDDYARRRATLIGETASLEQRPGDLAGLGHLAERAAERATAGSLSVGGIGTGEPTMAHLTLKEGDTVHIDVADRWGNVVSATPSGGWLQSSPVVPGLGFPMNSRAQMFWLDEGLPSSLRPRSRPRTTLSPSLAIHEDGRILSVGTPGGDQQDQWQLVFFLQLLRGEQSLQKILDTPVFHSTHVQASFAPRSFSPGGLSVEETLGAEVIAELKRRGHDVSVTPAWSGGRLTCAERRPDGQLLAAATPRMMQAYAVGR
ncbi:MAG: gamma-glutamyltransferase family protein [Devosia nanyangense]|nr:gamma-glutamyltransferase family protein [Devosia nanyangense]